MAQVTNDSVPVLSAEEEDELRRQVTPDIDRAGWWGRRVLRLYATLDAERAESRRRGEALNAALIERDDLRDASSTSSIDRKRFALAVGRIEDEDQTVGVVKVERIADEYDRLGMEPS